MDIWLINNLLQVHREEASSKSEVVYQLEQLFLSLKATGDTSLEIYEGKSPSNQSTWTKLFAISLVGNYSRNYIDLLIEIDTQRDIIQIQNCDDLICETFAIRKNKPLKLAVKEDEKIGKSVDFIEKENLYKKAISDLFQYKNVVIDTEVYSEWLEKHEELFDKTSLFSSESDFYCLYDTIKTIYNEYYIGCRKITEKAIEEYHKLDTENELEVSYWLTKYEKVFYNLFDLYMYMLYDNTPDTIKIRNLKFKKDDFKHQLEFCILFNHISKD